MSSKKAKSKKVSQNDLRKMMNEMKTKRTSGPNSRGKDGHALLKNPDAYEKALKDRKKLQAIIGGTIETDSAITPKFPDKRDHSFSNPNSVGRNEPTRTLKRTAKAPINDMTIEIESSRESKVRKTDSALEQKPAGLLLGNYSSDSEEDNTEAKPQQELESDKISIEETGEKEQDAALPEGFFDDPEVDAKMRGVETPADAMDREWDDFQKEIQRETDQSEQIVEEEEEVEKVDREIEEIDEQIMHLSRVEKLSNTRDRIQQKIEMEVDKNMDSNESDSDSDDADDVLDWREKDSHF